MKTIWPKGKIFILLGIVMIYVIIGVSLRFAVSAGVLEKAPLPIEQSEGTDTVLEIIAPQSIITNLQSAQSYFKNNMAKPSGHVNLYITTGNDKSLEDENTNSEAVSYYLLWLAEAGNRAEFDKELEFLQLKMLHPKFGSLMWRLQENDSVIDDGSNIATDADAWIKKSEECFPVAGKRALKYHGRLLYLTSYTGSSGRGARNKKGRMPQGIQPLDNCH